MNKDIVCIIHTMFDFSTLLGGGEGTNFRRPGEGKTKRIAMKFGMLVIGLEENRRSIDELAQTKKCFLGIP